MVPHQNQIDCTCDTNTHLYKNPTTGAYSCDACQAGETPSADGRACLTCGASTTDCACTAAGTRLVEYAATVECVACEYQTYVDSATGTCAECDANLMLVVNSAGTGCECVAGYEQRTTTDAVFSSGLGGGVACLDAVARTAIAAYDSASIGFKNLVGGESDFTLNSKLYEQLLMPAATECYVAVQAATSAATSDPTLQTRLAGNTACQAVANLCVLRLYDESSFACRLYDVMVDASTARAHADFPSDLSWFKRLPWLKYTKADVVDLTGEVDLSVDLSGGAGTLEYMLAAYTTNGTYAGLVNLTDQLQLCEGGANDRSAFRSVGREQLIACNVPLSALTAHAEPLFYDPYLVVENGQLYPVPIKLVNLDANTDLVTSNDQFVRRFFSADAMSGKTGASARLEGLTYIKSATLTVELEPKQPTKIMAPLLTLEYAMVKLDADAEEGTLAVKTADGVELASRFLSQYTMDLNDTNYSLLIAFVFAMVFWLLGWLFLMYIENRRSPFALDNQGPSLDSVVSGVAKLCRVFASVFFFLLFIAAGWMLIIYKEQRDIYVMLPISTGENVAAISQTFHTVLTATWVAALVHVLNLVYEQSHNDVFFIDREQPGESDPETAPAPPAATSTRAGDAKAQQQDQGDAHRPVSTWRMVFIANEWVKLQTTRSVYLEFSLFWLILFMQGTGLENFARRVPGGGLGEADVPFDPFLRFAVSSFLLGILAIVQYVVRWLFWDRYVQDKVMQFVDLLPWTNISCLILVERHFGYYLHGKRSGHVDTNIVELNRQFNRERTRKIRGLEEGSMCQTFEVYLSKEIREEYEETKGYFDNSSASSIFSWFTHNVKRHDFISVDEKNLSRQERTRDLLEHFFDGKKQSHPRKIRRKQFFENLISLPPNTNFSKESLLVEDTWYNFKRTLLSGVTYDFVLFNILTYAAFDMWTTNTYVAIFATYLFDLFFRFLRHQLSLWSISKSALIDQKFLLL